MKICAGLVLVLGLIVGAKADDGLATAYSAARQVSAKSRAVPVSYDRKAARILVSAVAFVPEGCAVQSWCLVKATDCFLGFVDNPRGVWQGHAQYSVVRRATAYCPLGYGKWETRTFMSGVEPQPFTSGIEYSKEEAGQAVMKLCQAYRTDWITAAPVCAN